MLTITSIIHYKARPNLPSPKLSRSERVKRVRAQRAEDGLCQNHGTELPCGKCAAATKRWRDGRKTKP